ncbi:MAG: Stealth CR1 domain-containing protein [Muribaculaceae bacterium]|nr:Stealth CR1 domain-containing protein [Muribaculaceae bacterium]
MKNEFKDMPVDLVYLWVNGNDPVWIEKRNRAIGKTEAHSAVNCDGRYADNDELKYSLRSAEMYAPWLRKIFIVTDNQVPEWLDTTNPKIQIIDHTEILPPEALPCFNSNVIEHFIFRIPDLSEHFLYANDDMYFNRPVTPDDFFAPDGLPYVRVNRRLFRKLELKLREKLLHKKLSSYNLWIQNAAKLVECKFGKYYGDKSHHNIDAYLKSNCIRTADMFREELTPTFVNHMREPNDIQRAIYIYTAMAEQRAHVRYVSQRESLRVHIDNAKHYKKLATYNPLLFCMNDSEYANDTDRMRSASYLQSRFPEKSKFEK